MGFSPDIHLLGKILASLRSAQVYLLKVGCTRAGLSLASVANPRLVHTNSDKFWKPVRTFHGLLHLSSHLQTTTVILLPPQAAFLLSKQSFHCLMFYNTFKKKGGG